MKAQLLLRRGGLLPGLVTLALIGFAGCGSGPKVYPVEGKVAYKGKGNIQQLTGGKVRFQSTSDPDMKIVGAIEDDGSFVMGTFVKERNLPGVPAGQYKALVEPPPDDEEGEPLRGLILPKYQDYDRSGLTVTVPLPGELVITVEHPRR